MPPSTRSPSLYDLALSRLRQLFPESRFVCALNKSKPAPVSGRTVNVKPATTNVISARCSVRACPYPAYSNGRCKSHLADLVALASMMPSCAAAAIAPLHRHSA
jgi:hypothetical protein